MIWISGVALVVSIAYLAYKKHKASLPGIITGAVSGSGGGSGSTTTTGGAPSAGSVITPPPSGEPDTSDMLMVRATDFPILKGTRNEASQYLIYSLNKLIEETYATDKNQTARWDTIISTWRANREKPGGTKALQQGDKIALGVLFQDDVPISAWDQTHYNIIVRGLGRTLIEPWNLLGFQP